MERKTVSGVMLTLLLATMLALTHKVHPIQASETIYIRPDGSIDPPTAPISTVDNVTYTFTDDIYDSIVVERSNIVIDGNGYAVQGSGVPQSRGISLEGIRNVTIKDTHIRDFGYAVRLNSTSHITLMGNNITAALNVGVYAHNSSNSSICGNTITNNSHGIQLLWSSNNSICSNKVTANSYSGILLFRSSKNLFRNNCMVDNSYNFGVAGASWGGGDYVNDIDTSNMVDGKPVYYWISERDKTVPPDAGYIALVNCTNITVSNLNLTNNWSSVLLAYTTNTTITRNNITNNRYSIIVDYSSNNNIRANNIWLSISGIALYSSSNNSIHLNNLTTWGTWGFLVIQSSRNTISENNIEGAGYAVYVWQSSNSNFISGNNIMRNHNGVYLHACKQASNTFSGNNIADNEYGIFLYEASNNMFYHNNLMNNTEQVYDWSWDHPETESSVNTWDNGYPSGGNYWSEYTDLDLYCGPNQDIWSSDGIWDHPYIIDENNTDNYPLVNPYLSGELSVSIHTDKHTYHPGETMHLGLDVTNPDTVKYACFAVWVELPNDTIHLYMHRHSVVLSIGLDYTDPVFKTIILPSLQTGTYTWHAAFLERATHTIITEDTTEFEIA